MKKTLTMDEIVGVAKGHVGENPIVQQLVDYYNHGGSKPDLASINNAISHAMWVFTARLDESYKEKIVDLYFTGNPDARLVSNFFKNSASYNYLLETAYHRYVSEDHSAHDFYVLLMRNSWQSNWLLMSENQRYALSLSESDLQPFGKFLLKQGEKDALEFIKVAMKLDPEDGRYNRVYRNLLFFHTFFPKVILENFELVTLYPANRFDKYLPSPIRALLVSQMVSLAPDVYEPLIGKYISKLTYSFESSKSEYLWLSKLYTCKPDSYKDAFQRWINAFIGTFTVVKKYPYGNLGLENKERARRERPMRRWDIPTIPKSQANRWDGESLVKLSFDALRTISEKDFNLRIKEFCYESHIMPIEVIPLVKDYVKENQVELFSAIIKHKNPDSVSEYFQVLMESMEGLDWSSIAKDIWKAGANVPFRHQVFAAKLLAQKPEVVKPFFADFGKMKKDERALAFLTLAQMDSDFAKDLLWTEFHKEKDEGVRDHILPIIARKFYNREFSRKEVDEIIELSIERDAYKKGLKGNVLDFSALPPLYFKDGTQLSLKQIQFLIYRMAQIRIMISDPEAKLLMNHIDKTKSTAFAKAILETFLEKGAVAKQKYIMCLAGILGDESLLDYLKKLFKDLHDGKRLKMAQYVIATIAMIGTDKALRHVEYISRKYKRKASLEAAAVEALENAAEELGMDIFELSDKIIPDFGFDGLYKTIDADDEEIRVFVGKDFKLQFITEDNKVRKSVPKAVGKEVKAELKLIQKEIREVNRAQKERLEQYMVLERRWAREDWEKFYLMNPVMFIYASTLVWGVFDENNQLKQLFYVDEDASLMDLEDDEIELMDGKLGIVHTLRMSKEQKTAWGEKFYELDIAQPFEQLNRPVFYLSEEEKEQNSITRYNKKGAEKGGRATQGHFERRGWRKEVSDGGCFDLSKTFKQEKIYAFLNVTGMCIGWYDEAVEFYDITFMKVGESSWNDDRILLKDVPEIVFSEVIADMDSIVKKEANS